MYYWLNWWHLVILWKKSAISKYWLIIVYNGSYIWKCVRNRWVIRNSGILILLLFLIFSLFWVRLSLFRFFNNRNIIQYLRAYHAPIYVKFLFFLLDLVDLNFLQSNLYLEILIETAMTVGMRACLVFVGLLRVRDAQTNEATICITTAFHY